MREVFDFLKGNAFTFTVIVIILLALPFGIALVKQRQNTTSFASQNEPIELNDNPSIDVDHVIKTVTISGVSQKVIVEQVNSANKTTVPLLLFSPIATPSATIIPIVTTQPLPTASPNPVQYIRYALTCLKNPQDPGGNEIPGSWTPDSMCQDAGYSSAVQSGTAAKAYYWWQCGGASISHCNGLDCTVTQYDCNGASAVVQQPYPTDHGPGEVSGTASTTFVTDPAGSGYSCVGYNGGAEAVAACQKPTFPATDPNAVYITKNYIHDQTNDPNEICGANFSVTPDQVCQSAGYTGGAIQSGTVAAGYYGSDAQSLSSCSGLNCTLDQTDALYGGTDHNFDSSYPYVHNSLQMGAHDATFGAGGGTTAKDCGNYAPSMSIRVACQPNVSPTAPPVVTTGYKLLVSPNLLADSAAEDAAFTNVTVQTYPPTETQTATSIDLTGSLNTPGIVFIYVQFIKSDGTKEVEHLQAQVVGPDPSVDGLAASCTSNITNTGTNVVITGRYFGDSSHSGTVKLADGTQVSVYNWSDSEIDGTINSAPSPNQSYTMTMTTGDGRSVSSISCQIGSSAITLHTSPGCPTFTNLTSKGPITDVELTAVADVPNSPVDKETVSIDSKGQVSNLKASFIKGQTYIITVKLPHSIRESAKFVAPGPTTTVDFPTALPLGDIAPAPSGDGSINSFDLSRLIDEFNPTQTTSVLDADLNEDGSVNSVDYACIRQFEGKSDSLTADKLIDQVATPSATLPPEVSSSASGSARL